MVRRAAPSPPLIDQDEVQLQGIKAVCFAVEKSNPVLNGTVNDEEIPVFAIRNGRAVTLQ
jgi:hypothetical protein